MTKEFFSKEVEEVHYQEYLNYRISYIIEKDFNLLFLFINSINDDYILIKREISICKDDFLTLFKEDLEERIDSERLKAFDPAIYNIQKKFPPIISLVGDKGIGKTTITNLVRTNTIPVLHDSKISGEIATLKLGKMHILIRDFTGEEEIGFLWNNFINGSDAVFVVVDSKLETIEKSKFFLNKIEEQTPFAYPAVLCNKQDILNILNLYQIEEILGLKTYAVIATNSEYKEKLIHIILETLEMYDETLSVLNLINERELLIKEFEEELIKANFEKANSLYEKILDVCSILGDNPVEMEFHKKYLKVKKKLKKSKDFQEILTSTAFVSKELPSRKISSLESVLKNLLLNYMENVKGIKSVIISDRDGLIITSESSKETEDESLLGAIAVLVDTYIDRIKKEFGRESSFFNITTIQDKKFAYCSKGPNSILLTISDLSPSDTELRIYSEHVASKIELLLEGNENVSIQIPEIVKALSKTKEGKIPKGSFSFKIIITGDYSVGKTSLIQRYVVNLFREIYHSTVGIEIHQKDLELSENSKIRLIIWDIGGQLPKIAPYRKKFYEGAKFAFIVIDRTRLESLKSVEKWYNEIHSLTTLDTQVVLIGNKSDLVDDLVITELDIKNVADKYKFHYIITSALTGENVNDAFLYVAYKFLESV
ncbi:MAG: ADP-ribosylation factor-like protein [Candidatus Thorarchaeota archaeon]